MNLWMYPKETPEEASKNPKEYLHPNVPFQTYDLQKLSPHLGPVDGVFYFLEKRGEFAKDDHLKGNKGLFELV